MNRRYHVRFPAIIYIALAVLVGVAAANRPNNLLVFIFGILIAAILTSGLVSGVMMLGVRVVRLDPRHGRVGEPLSVRYAITDRNRWLALFNLQVEEMPDGRAEKRASPGDAWKGYMAPASAWIMHVGPLETVHGEAIFWPTRRGRIRLGGLRVWSSFPLGLIRKSVSTTQEQFTLIYPELIPLKLELLRAVTPSGSGGSRMSRSPGQGSDYFGMREYKPGDSIRQVSWRRTATLDQPIIIERTRPSPPRLRVVLNLQRPTDQLRFDTADAPDGRTLEEVAISLAASFLQMAERQGYEVGLTVLGLDERPTPLRKGHWHVQKLLGALAALQLDQPRRDSGGGQMPDAERAGLVIISPDRADPRLGASSGPDGALQITARQLKSLRADLSGASASRLNQRSRREQALA